MRTQTAKVLAVPREKSPIPTSHVTVRFPTALVERIDAYAEDRSAALGLVDRTHAMMELLISALDAADAKKRPRK